MAKSCWGLCVGVVAVVHSTVNVAAPELVCSPCCLGEPGLAAFSFRMVDDGNAWDVYSRMLTSGFVWTWVADVWVCVSLGCWRLGLCEPGLLTSGFVWAWVADVWVCVSLGCWCLGLCEPGLLSAQCEMRTLCSGVWYEMSKRAWRVVLLRKSNGQEMNAFWFLLLLLFW